MTNVTAIPTPLRHAIPASDTRWRGALEGCHQNLLFGWAVDCAHPDARVVVEICFNGEAVGTVIADVARTDIANAISSDVCHGFVADIGSIANKETGTLSARIANTNVTLPGEIRLDNPAAAPLPATSHVFNDGALRLHGWAVDARDPKRTVQVHAYLGGELLASTIANMRHPHLGVHYANRNGFTLDLPLALADGGVHEVRFVDDEGRALNGSPVTVCCYLGGGKALLPQEGDSLLGEVLDAYERHLPRSLGFQHYAAWTSVFEKAPEQPRPSGRRKTSGALTVGVIITGEGDQDATLHSLQQQQGITGKAFPSRIPGQKTQTFSVLLQQAIDSGVDAITCLRAGDTLLPHTIASTAEALKLEGAQIAYTDSEDCTQPGTARPWFKPAWNPEYALGTDYPLELMLVRTSLAEAAYKKAVDLPADAAAHAWHMLGKVWQQGERAIVHVPRVLYRFHSSLTDSERQARHEAAQQTLRTQEPQSLLQAVEPATVPALPTDFTPRQLMRAAMASDTAVSLIIPTRDRVELLERCIGSIKRYTQWPRLEIIVVDNDSTDPKTKAYLRNIARQGVRVIAAPGAFNFSALNNLAVEAASGDVIGLINNDIEALHEGWLEEILGHLAQPNVGAVGAKLLWPNGMVQHGGVLLGVGNVAAHYGNALADADLGDHGRNQLAHRVSGVTAACLFMRKADYLAVGGLDESAFPIAFNDVDLCLKLRAQGKAIIWTPQARLLHAESASRGREDSPQKRARAQREIEHLRKRWGAVLLNDPAYHPSLNLDAHAQAFGGLALPPRNRAPRFGTLRTEVAALAGKERTVRRRASTKRAESGKGAQ